MGKLWARTDVISWESFLVRKIFILLFFFFDLPWLESVGSKDFWTRIRPIQRFWTRTRADPIYPPFVGLDQTVLVILLTTFFNLNLTVAPKKRDTFSDLLCSANSTLYKIFQKWLDGLYHRVQKCPELNLDPTNSTFLEPDPTDSTDHCKL